MAKSTDLNIPCPACGRERTVTMREWKDTFIEETKWNAKANGYIRTSGPNEMIECYACKDSYPAGQWHRSYERRELKKRGWRTPRMEAEHGPM